MSRDKFLPTVQVALAGAMGMTVLLAACKEPTAPRVVSSVTATSTAMQPALAGPRVATPPSGAVRDRAGQPLAGTQVSFVVTAGGGTVVGSPVTTDATGTARIASWTLGTA